MLKFSKDPDMFRQKEDRVLISFEKISHYAFCPIQVYVLESQYYADPIQASEVKLLQLSYISMEQLIALKKIRQKKEGGEKGGNKRKF